MPIPAFPLSRFIAGACFVTFSGCLFDATPQGPTLGGHFGNRLDGLPPLALFDSSFAALGMMRELSGDSYTYQMSYHSFLGDGSAHWQVTIQAGAPMREEFTSVGADGTGFQPADPGWLRVTRAALVLIRSRLHPVCVRLRGPGHRGWAYRDLPG